MKNSEKKSDAVKDICVAAGVLFALLLVVVIYQTFAIMQPETGFFIEHDISVPIFYILAIGGVVFVCCHSYINAKSIYRAPMEKPSAAYVVSSILFALTVLYDSVVEFIELKAEKAAYIENEEEIRSIFGNMKDFTPLLGAITAVVLIVSVYGSGNEKMRKILGIPMLVPTLWGVLKLTDLFSVNISFLKVAPMLIAVFSQLFLMVFLFENSRYTVGVGRKGSCWFFFASGLIAAGLGICICIPTLLCKIFTPENSITMFNVDLYWYFGALWALVSVIEAAKSKNTVPPAEDENPDIPEITETL